MTELEIKARIYDLLVLKEQAQAEINRLQNELAQQQNVEKSSEEVK